MIIVRKILDTTSSGIGPLVGLLMQIFARCFEPTGIVHAALGTPQVYLKLNLVV